MEVPFETTCDAFLDGRINVRQPAKGFRSGMEAVFMAAACPATGRAKVLEAGCGAGVASLCLLTRLAEIEVTGIEADASLAQLARENAAANGFEDRFTVISASLANPWGQLEMLGAKRESYDHAIANPPFFVHGRGRLSTDAQKAAAKAMKETGLELWLRFLAAAVRPGGSTTVIHASESLPPLLRASEGRFGGLRIIPIYSSPGGPAIRVLLSGVKGSRAALSIAPGITLQEPDGAPSGIAERVLRQGLPLS
jgi:tRNA1(Val) A37 N6-methylase TrmN6